ncbi:MAG: Ig-like domain-containing protein [Gemmatimonadaceae bacterium]|nr:Ig-like domain-containing protein [Gemmatimonadaceae bacterium]
MTSVTHPIWRSAVLLLGLTACGGGTDSTPGNPTTPIPPTIGAPASLAVSGGDGQSTFAGAVLAVTPTVTVRDAAGQPVAGAAINFEVVSGGGSIAGSVATSNAQGVATAGAWTLGSSGEQIVEAKHGSLTPARFRATISTGIVDATIPASGGVIEISTPAHPWRGLKLTIPTGAFAESGTWRFELASGVPIPTLPAAFTVNGPALRIETDRGRAARLMTLRIPALRVAGSVRMFVLVDPARSAMEMAPIVAEDSESITVVVGHLNASMLLSRSGANSSVLLPTQQSTRQLNFGLGINVNATLNALGLTEALAGYLANAWPGPDMGSYGFPAGHGPAIALMNLFGQLQNQPFSGLVGLLPAFGVLADTASFASLQIMADRHRRSPTAQRAIDDLSAALASVTIPLRDSLSTINLWGGLSISKLPQLMVFEERFVPTTGRRVFASMYGKGNGALLFSSPTAPATQSTLTLGVGGFSSRIVKENADATSFNAQGVLPVGGSFIYPVAEFVDVVPTMMAALRAQGAVRDQANRQLAAAAGFPNVTLEVQNAATGDWSPADTTIVIRDSAAVLRVQCGNCPQALPQNGSGTQQTVAVENRSPAGYAGLLFGLGPQSAGTLLNALGVGDLSGAAMTLMDPSLTLSSIGAAYRAAVPIHRPLALALFRLTPDSQRVVTDSLVLLRAKLDLPPPSGYYIDWDFGDATPIVRTTDVAEASHRYTTPATRAVRAVLRNGVGSAVPNLLLALAKGKVVVEPDTMRPYWRITSFTANPLDPPEDREGYPFSPLLERLIAVPASGLIAIDTVAPGNGSRLAVRVRTTSTWIGVTCCPPPLQGTELVQELGRTPASSYPLGNYFAAYRTNTWSQSTGNLGAGTMLASRIDGTHAYGVMNAGTQVGPTVAWRLKDVVRNGLQMTGKIAFYWWGVDDNGVIETVDHETWFQFTATRLR